MQNIYDVAIIGAGISGATVANRLSQAGLKVMVVDKARGTGGRLSSRRLSVRGQFGAHHDAHVTLPMGTAGFSGVSDTFEGKLASWFSLGCVGVVSDGSVSIETGMDRGAQVYTGSPRSSSLTRGLLADTELCLSSRVIAIRELDVGWEVLLENGESLFARQVVIATPPAQAAAILPTDHQMVKSLEDIKMLPQWVVVISVDSGDIGAVNALIHHPLIEQVVVQTNPLSEAKSVRQMAVLHICREWSQRNSSLEPQHVTDEVLAWASEDLSADNVEVLHVHRWLYAHCPDLQKLPYSHFWQAPRHGDKGGLGICGDYFTAPVPVSGGVESALLSSDRLSDDMVHSMMPVIQPA